jgi:hypothetical protein
MQITNNIEDVNRQTTGAWLLATNDLLAFDGLGIAHQYLELIDHLIIKLRPVNTPLPVLGALLYFYGIKTGQINPAFTIDDRPVLIEREELWVEFPGHTSALGELFRTFWLFALDVNKDMPPEEEYAKRDAIQRTIEWCMALVDFKKTAIWRNNQTSPLYLHAGGILGMSEALVKYSTSMFTELCGSIPKLKLLRRRAGLIGKYNAAAEQLQSTAGEPLFQYKIPIEYARYKLADSRTTMIKTITGNVSLEDLSEYIGFRSLGVGAILTESARIAKATKDWLSCLSRFAKSEYTVGEKKQGYWYAESALNASVVGNQLITQNVTLSIDEYRHLVGEGLNALTIKFKVPEEFAHNWILHELDDIGNTDLRNSLMQGNLNRVVWSDWSTTVNLPGAAKGRPPLQHRHGRPEKKRISPALATSEQLAAFNVGIGNLPV